MPHRIRYDPGDESALLIPQDLLLCGGPVPARANAAEKCAKGHDIIYEKEHAAISEDCFKGLAELERRSQEWGGLKE